MSGRLVRISVVIRNDDWLEPRLLVPASWSDAQIEDAVRLALENGELSAVPRERSEEIEFCGVDRDPEGDEHHLDLT